MFKLGQRLRISIQLSQSRLLSTSQLVLKKNDDESSKKANIQDLLAAMQQPANEDSESVQDFMNNIKKSNVVKNRMNPHKQIKQIKHEQGEEFWFKQAKSKQKKKVKNLTSDNNKKIEAINTKEDVEVEISDGSKDKNAVNTISQLKDNILERADNRSVSKLMSALIEEIDGDLPDPEDKLKALMIAMSKKKAASFPHEEQITRFYDGKRKRKSLSLTFGETSSLFLDSKYLAVTKKYNAENKVSLHEQQWHNDLISLLPECVPQNSFEEMMLDIDRQWKFPIDNEQDMGIEEETTFDQHIFLDYLLDEFPEEGPIRKFMELVVTGLQQNPHLSVEEKENRVFWFRDYFKTFPNEEILL